MNETDNAPVVCWKSQVRKKDGTYNQIALGETFGRLTVLARAPDYIQVGGKKAGVRGVKLLVKCSCGESPAFMARSAGLLDGKTSSCGCVRSERARAASSTRPAKLPPIEPGMSWCSGCKKDQPAENFHNSASSRDGSTTYCRSCTRDQQLYRRYGITSEQYDATYDSQNGRCLICSAHHVRGGSRPGLQPRDVLVVDHCHAEGEVRGLICHACNMGLARIDSCAESLLYLLAYLQDPPASGMKFCGEDVPEAAGFARLRHGQLRRVFRDSEQRRMGLQDLIDLLELQGNECAGCGAPIGGDACVDHEHRAPDGSGPVRGCLCRSCNAALGQLAESEEIIDRALAYVLKSKKHEGATAESLGLTASEEELTMTLASIDITAPPQRPLRKSQQQAATP